MIEESPDAKFCSLIEQILQLCAHSSDTQYSSLDEQGGIPFQGSKMPFTAQEKAQILQYYHQTGSVRITQRWVRRTMQRNPPHATDIARWQRNFRETGNLGHRRGNGRPRITAERVEEVRQMFQENPRLDIRSASATLNISRSSVQRILRRCLLLYPYKMQNLHLMRDSDRQSRLDFANYCHNHPDGYSDFLSKIVFTDECMFRLNGHVNTQNVRIWGTERPTEGNQVPVYSSGVMAWCGITKEKVIGPYWVEGGTVTGDSYKFMLSRKVFPALRRLEREYVFQQDGAGPHRASSVRAYLNRKCDNHWIGRQGPIDWPARSPDLSPCDFFCGDTSKERCIQNLCLL